jgi:predicted negative regulator of RcsB-dependent stress response
VSERITRKDLRTDNFAVALEHNVEYVSEHRGQVIRVSAIVLAVILLAAGIYYYRTVQHEERQNKLADAIQIQEAPIIPTAVQNGAITFPTDQAKRDAATKAFSELAGKYSGSREGVISEYYLGSIASDGGNLAEARKHFQAAADSGDANYGSLAKLSLAELADVENRPADAEKILRDLVAHPTIMVSADQATVSLARHLAKTKPAEARKLLEPLTGKPTAASQAAVQILGEMQQNP